MNKHRKLIAVDFDGVLHSYDTPWTDAATISDGPTPGAMAFLRQLVEDDRFAVGLVSSRLATDEGCHAVKHWLGGHLRAAFGMSEGQAIKDAIVFYTERPPAFLTIDDRAVTFDGTWPDLDELAAFKPWNKRWKVDKENSYVGAVSSSWSATLDGAIPLSEFDLAPGAILPLPSPMVDLDILREVSRRAYAAGCEAHEFHEADCQDEVGAILDDVLGRKVAPTEYDAEAVRIASDGLVPRAYPPAVMVEDEDDSRG